MSTVDPGRWSCPSGKANIRHTRARAWSWTTVRTCWATARPGATRTTLIAAGIGEKIAVAAP